MEINLKELDYYHPLRNSPLLEIGAYYLPKDSKVWAEIRPAYGIATKTFNQLDDVWLIDEWKATKYSEDWQSNERDWAIAQNGNVGYE